MSIPEVEVQYADRSLFSIVPPPFWPQYTTFWPVAYTNPAQHTRNVAKVYSIVKEVWIWKWGDEMEQYLNGAAGTTFKN